MMEYCCKSILTLFESLCEQNSSVMREIQMEPFWQYFHMTLFVFKHFQKLSLHFSFSFFGILPDLKHFRE